jgi:hypothetical protein
MARSDGTKHSDSTKQAKPATQRGRNAPPDARAEQGADTTEEQKALTDEAKLRSDWEGMAPKPDQGSDDIAAPGALPNSDPRDN